MVFSLRFKIIFITVVILIFSIAVTTLVNTYVFSQEQTDALQSRTLIIGQGIKSQLDRLLELGIPLEELEGFDKQLQNAVNTYEDVTYAMIVNPDGKVLFHNDPSQQDQMITEVTVLGAVQREENVVQFYSDQTGQFYDVFIPIFDRSGTHGGAIRLGFPIELVTQKTNRLIIFSGAVALVSLGVAITVLIFALSAWVTNPLAKLLTAIQGIKSGEMKLAARVEINSRDEIGELATAFNTLASQLSHSIDTLEDQVRDRTTELALSMEVGQRAAAIRNLDELLPTITEYIRTQFNLYYTQVYFVDDLEQNLILRAGTGSVGQELVARRHQLPIGLGSIVGRVAAEGKSIVVADTQNSDIHKPNPLLPETRSELAIPLVVEGRVIGVLDMQADKTGTFTENNVTVFEAMATQLAISINSAQQWVLSQEAQHKAEEAVRQLTRQSWLERLASRREGLGFAYDLVDIAPVSAVDPETASDGKELVAPLVIQNESIGQLTVKVPPRRALSADTQGLVAAVAQQLAQKAENLRLFEQTQQRAAREQLARQITEKVRASRDIETALKIAAEELAKNLSVSRAVVDLRLASDDKPVGDTSRK
ncbi:MAG: hypothetical protein BroJett011_25380 [Chloroflexota bacterium]|nr:MAG: hypothetical protein BroJett011_25380 [Chloroflexota bacterium]